ncbi:MAG: carboxypeptidase regulatory-like domain-containing protein [Candidatus Altiarchaeota archaeon]
MLKHATLLAIALILLSPACIAQETAVIEGHIRDGNNGAPYSNLRVDIFKTGDFNKPVASTYSNSNGYFNTTVSPGSYYDIYVRMGETNPNQRTSSVVEANGVYTVNFDISAESTYSDDVVEKYGFWMVVLVALLILFLIFVDQLFFRRKRIIRDLEERQSHLQNKLDQAKPEGDELSALQHEMHELEYMINLTKIKYHKRGIDEESYREIIRDYQKRLIEVEAKIKSLKGDS